jgi:hypothetical protein
VVGGFVVGAIGSVTGGEAGDDTVGSGASTIVSVGGGANGIVFAARSEPPEVHAAGSTHETTTIVPRAHPPAMCER